MIRIVHEEDATLNGLLFLASVCMTDKRVSDIKLLSAKNMWYPSSGGLENFFTHLLSPVSRDFECALEDKAGRFRHKPHGFNLAVNTLLRRLKVARITPVAGESDPFLMFNVSSVDNTAYFVASWPRMECFVVLVYAREINRVVLANIKQVDEALTRLIAEEVTII